MLSFLLLAAKSQTKVSREEITPFIINSMILKDTTQIKSMPVYRDAPSETMTLYEYNESYRNAEHFLSPQQFSAFRDMVWSVVKSPKSKVYIYPENKAATKKEVFEKTVMCDSIVMTSFDPQGNEITSRHWICDSLSKIYNIQRIDFYETWYFNKATNMIDRETLGYSLWEYISDMGAYRPLFYVLKDEKAAQKVRKFIAY